MPTRSPRTDVDKRKRGYKRKKKLETEQLMPDDDAHCVWNIDRKTDCVSQVANETLRKTTTRILWVSEGGQPRSITR